MKKSYKTTKDCFFCPFIANCKDRRDAKKPIDLQAAKIKQMIVQFNLMPARKNKREKNLYSGIIHRSKKSRKRFLKHLHHDYDVVAAAIVWNDPSLLRHAEPSKMGEIKNKIDTMTKANLQQKIDRHVTEYHTYDFEYDKKLFTVKTELTTHGYEQFYALYEYRNLNLISYLTST